MASGLQHHTCLTLQRKHRGHANEDLIHSKLKGATVNGSLHNPFIISLFQCLSFICCLISDLENYSHVSSTSPCHCLYAECTVRYARSGLLSAPENSAQRFGVREEEPDTIGMSIAEGLCSLIWSLCFFGCGVLQTLI